MAAGADRHLQGGIHLEAIQTDLMAAPRQGPDAITRRDLHIRAAHAGARTLSSWHRDLPATMGAAKPLSDGTRAL